MPPWGSIDFIHLVFDRIPRNHGFLHLRWKKINVKLEIAIMSIYKLTEIYNMEPNERELAKNFDI